jgi:hypothetical protein
MEQPTSSSQIPAQLENKVLDVVVRELNEMKQKVANIENNKILDELKLPEEDLRAMGVIQPNARRIRRGKGARPILESEILEAQKNSNSAAGCARYLGVGYNCYKKWAKTYGIFQTNSAGKGELKHYWSPNKGKYPLNQILEGQFPDYPIYRLKDKIIRSGIKEAKCENCGFDERRITDQKMPLLISFKDGNEKNHILENIEILCYNCMFIMGRGYIRRGKVEFNFVDPDRIQGSPRKVEARF